MSKKKMIKTKNQKMVYLKWHDAFSDAGWKKKEDVKDFINKEYCICENVGWIIFEDKKEIILCARRLCWIDSEDDDDEIGLFQKIPVGWIVERSILT